MMGLALFLVALWVLFNFVAGYAPLVLAERVSPGRIPATLMVRSEASKVRFYVGDNKLSYAFSVWAPPYTAVVFDRRFFLNASPDMLRFVIAHELGHARHRHHIIRWLVVVTGAVLLPRVRAMLRRHEEVADMYAIALTGLSKEMFPQLT